MNKLLVVDKLQKIGFTKSEATLYVTLIAFGPQTPLQLSRKTRINRTKVYRIARKLKQKKLLEETDASWGKKINATPPDFLREIILEEIDQSRKKELLLPSLITELDTLFKTPETSFESKYFRGTDGIKQMYWNVLHAKGDVLVFGYTDRNKLVGRRFAEKVRTEQVQRKITMYELANHQPEYDDIEYTKVPGWKKYYTEKFISEDILKIRHQITVFNDVVSIKNFVKSEKAGIEIKNQLLADMHRQVFWHFWN